MDKLLKRFKKEEITLPRKVKMTNLKKQCNECD